VAAEGRLAFTDDPKECDPPELVARIGAADSKAALLEALALALQIPEPHGRNWNALDEMLTSLEWTNARSVWIVHEAVPRLLPPDLDIYLSILRDANAFWEKRGDRSLLGVFPSSAEAELQRGSAERPNQES
jgi:hypothetical protein